MSQKTISLEMVKQAGVLLKQEHEHRLRLEDEIKGLEKTANDLGLEKRAMKLAFREVELGFSDPYLRYEDLMEKVATLMKEDLDVLEKALERGYGSGSRKAGELTEASRSSGLNVFQNWVLNGELE